MARVEFQQRDQLTPEQIAFLKAQTQRLGAQSANEAADMQTKREIAMAQLANEQGMNTAKIGLGDRELTSKEKLGRQATAAELLGYGSKEKIASEGERGAIASDVLKRTDLDPKVAAATLASLGQPGMYNALAQKELDARERAVNSMIPALQKPMSGGETARSAKYRAALETQGGPGAYDEALARAYPKPENAAARAIPAAATYNGPAPTSDGGQANWATLATQLLGNNGETTSGGGAPTRTSVTAEVSPYPMLPNTPETSYTGLGHGALEGSQPVAGGIQTPSGGFIGTPNGVTPGLASLIAPREGATTATTTASIPDWQTGAAILPNPNASPNPTASQLLAAAATPTPQPVVAPTATPVPQATPQITPDALALLLKQKQQQSAY